MFVQRRFLFGLSHALSICGKKCATFLDRHQFANAWMADSSIFQNFIVPKKYVRASTSLVTLISRRDAVSRND